jgi:hypothetical protein
VKVRQKLSVGKRAEQWFHTEKFNLKNINVEIKQEYQVKISNRFGALENYNDDDVDINR